MTGKKPEVWSVSDVKQLAADAESVARALKETLNAMLKERLSGIHVRAKVHRDAFSKLVLFCQYDLPKSLSLARRQGRRGSKEKG